MNHNENQLKPSSTLNHHTPPHSTTTLRHPPTYSLYRFTITSLRWYHKPANRWPHVTPSTNTAWSSDTRSVTPSVPTA